MNKNLRYELKMVSEAHNLGLVRSWLFEHTNAFRETFPTRQVNNIYFDTMDRDFFLDHVDGKMARAKFRYRWYGESWQPPGGQLEIKIKIGQLSFKIIQPINAPVDLERSNWREIIAVFEADSLEKYAYLLAGYAPTMINRYQREYYVSMDGIVRVTLDYGMRNFEQSFGFSPNILFENSQRDDLIIELKAAKDEHQRVADALAEFPLRCRRNSKYLNSFNSM